MREFIEKIELEGESATVESGMKMWSGQSVTYSFDGMPDGDLALQIDVRQDLQKLPLVVEMKGVDLP